MIKQLFNLTTILILGLLVITFSVKGINSFYLIKDTRFLNEAILYLEDFPADEILLNFDNLREEIEDMSIILSSRPTLENILNVIIGIFDLEWATLKFLVSLLYDGVLILIWIFGIPSIIF